MHLRQFEIFRAVMRTGSVTEAAKLLAISQPAVSKLLRHTEDQLGVKLFERRNGRLFPTAEAEALYPPVDSIFGNIDTVQKIAQDLRDLRTGMVRIATIPTLGISLLPRAIARFRAKHDNVRVGIKVVSAEQVVERVLNQQVDFGIAYAPASHEALKSQELFAAEVVCVIPPRHSLADLPSVSPSHVARYPLISANRMTPIGLLTDEAFREAGVVRNSVVEASHSAIAYALAAAGVGVAVVDPFANAPSNFPNLIAKPFVPSLRINPRLLYSATRPLSRINQQFVLAMQQVCESEPDRADTRADPVPRHS